MDLCQGHAMCELGGARLLSGCPKRGKVEDILGTPSRPRRPRDEVERAGRNVPKNTKHYSINEKEGTDKWRLTHVSNW